MTRAKDISRLITDADISGNIDVDGTTNLDVVDIDGAVDMATTLAVAGNVDFNGDLDVDGTTNLDVTDIDGTLNVAGETTLQTHLNMGDNDAIKLGDGGDLQIQHTGSDSRIVDSGTGSLFIGASTLGILNPALNEYMINATSDGSVDLYHNNAVKLVTASTGVNVTGGIGLGGTGTANILDDYEEGTWTPSFQTSPSGSISSLAGQYTKIGRLVYVQVQVAGSSIAIGSYARIQGLPFASQDDADTGTYILGSIATRGHGWTTIASGTNQWYFSTSGTVSSNTQMSASAVYRTDV